MPSCKRVHLGSHLKSLYSRRFRNLQDSKSPSGSRAGFSSRSEHVRQLKGRTAAKRGTIPPMWHGLPSTFDCRCVPHGLRYAPVTGRVQSVAPYQLYPLGRDMLCELCQEVTGLEHMHVFFEILVLMGMEKHPTPCVLCFAQSLGLAISPAANRWA